MRDNDEGAALNTARIENSKDDDGIDGNQSDSNYKHESQDASLASTKFAAEYKTAILNLLISSISSISSIGSISSISSICIYEK